MSNCVLIVEDDEDSRVVLEKGLQSKGFEVISATNGVEALTHLEENRTDIIISDIMMPHMDGYELCRSVKTSDELSAIPFVFYTATFVGEEEKRLGLSLGACEYIIKPAELNFIAKFINETLANNTPDNKKYETGSTSTDQERINDLYKTVLSRKLEKKVAELEEERDKLLKSEYKFRHLVEDLRKEHFFYQQNIQGGFTYLSPSVMDILGYPEPEFLSHYTKYMTDHPCNEEAKEKVQLCVQGVEQESYPVQVYHKDGSVHHLELTEHPVFDDSGKVIAVEGVAHDITAVKSLERQFQQAQKMEALGTLVGGIAHDFNNILAGMLGSIYLAKNSSGDPEMVNESLSSANELGFRAADMIQQLLTFARQEEVSKSTLPITPFFNEAIKLIRAGIEESIRFSSRGSGEKLFVNANSTQLQQLLFNLVNNARDALEHTENPEISVSLNQFVADSGFINSHPESAHDHFALIEVQDNGEGIPEENLDQMFDPFFTTKEVGKGTGLGLAMVYSSVRDHGGILEVESKVGQGTSFKIYLPLAETGVQVERAASDIRRGYGETILLVDDDLQLQDITKAILTKLGYQVIVASDGREAADLFAVNADQVDLVIMDVVMPKMNGPAAAKEMRQIDRKVKIIYMTGYDSKDILTSQLEQNIESMLNKPCPIDHMSRMIREQLD